VSVERLAYQNLHAMLIRNATKLLDSSIHFWRWCSWTNICMNDSILYRCGNLAESSSIVFCVWLIMIVFIVAFSINSCFFFETLFHERGSDNAFLKKTKNTWWIQLQSTPTVVDITDNHIRMLLTGQTKRIINNNKPKNGVLICADTADR
jgi:hypothetical protein